jgi:hypothetical protein
LISELDCPVNHCSKLVPSFYPLKIKTPSLGLRNEVCLFHSIAHSGTAASYVIFLTLNRACPVKFFEEKERGEFNRGLPS